MDLTEITQVQEITAAGTTTSSLTNATNKVNKLLKEGWILLSTYKTCYDEVAFPNQQNIHYVLGLPANANINSPAHKPFKFND